MSIRAISLATRLSCCLIVLAVALPLGAQNAPFSGTAMVGGSFSPSGATAGSNVVLDVTVDLRNINGKTSGGSNTPAVLGGFQISIDFDPAKLQYLSPAGGTTSQFSSAPTDTDPSDANASGDLVIVNSQTSSSAPTGLVSVARLTFKVKTSGSFSVQAAPMSLSSAFQPPSAGPAAIPGSGSTISGSAGTAPGSPSNLSPSNGASGLSSPVTLEWTTASGATSYRVYLGTSSSSLQHVHTTTSTSYAASVQPGRTYFWRIHAYNTFGSNDGPMWSFTTESLPCINPTAPLLSGPSESDNGIAYSLSWNVVSGATEYEIEESESPSFAGATRSITSSPSRTFSHIVCEPKTFYYRTRALNTSDGCNVTSGWSSTRSVVVRPTGSTAPPPPPPATLQIIPVAGSVEGQGGSFFRTEGQLHNPYETAISGRLIFRRQGIPGSSADPFMTYSLGPQETMVLGDVVLALGTSGIGSIDISAEVGGLPISSFRIFEDSGDEGTTGLTADAISENDVPVAGDQVVLIVPPSQEIARFNIGIRTLGEGATVTATVRGNDGTVLHTITRGYGANFFLQAAAADLLLFAPPDSATVRFQIDSGRAVIYGTITDNKTQDPSLQVARKVTE